MCGRITLQVDPDILVQALWYPVGNIEGYSKRYNISPTQNVLGIKENADNSKAAIWFKWGIVISSNRIDEKGKELNLFNARAETIATKPSFKNSFLYRRCLIIADGFFEWAKVGEKKQPYYFTLKDRKPFAFAGLYEDKNIKGVMTPCCTIITTEANELVKPVHNRMPVILEQKDYELWLGHNNKDKEALLSLLKPLAPELMKSQRVAATVNSSKIDNEQCVQAL